MQGSEANGWGSTQTDPNARTLATLQAELVEAGLPTRVHDEGQFLERCGFVRFDQDRDVFVDVLYLPQQFEQLFLPYFAAIERQQTSVVDPNCDCAFELVFP